MNVSIGPRWEDYVSKIVAEGRYASASEVMREGLRLVEEREEKMRALRETIQASLARGGTHSWEDVIEHIDAQRDRRNAQGG